MPTTCPECEALVPDSLSSGRDEDGDRVLRFRCQDCQHEWTVKL